MPKVSLCTLLVASTLLASCDAARLARSASGFGEDGNLMYDGVGQIPSGTKSINYTVQEQVFLTAFAISAGQADFTPADFVGKSNEEIAQTLIAKSNTILKSSSISWPEVFRAGVNYVDRECSRYTHHLFRLERLKTAATSELSLLGAAVASILGITSASSGAISVVATAFGVTTGSIDVVTDSFLYKMETSAVVEVVKNAQGALLKGITDTNVNTRNGTIKQLQTYMSTCMPSTIENLVNKAARDQNYSYDPQEASFRTITNLEELRARIQGRLTVTPPPVPQPREAVQPIPPT